jgi:hypothetical protein
MVAMHTKTVHAILVSQSVYSQAIFHVRGSLARACMAHKSNDLSIPSVTLLL